MANLLKKIEIGNPLYNLGLHKLLEDYNATTNDEELANAYHKILNACEGSDVTENLTYAMIAYSTDIDINPVHFYMQQVIYQHNIKVKYGN